MGAMLEIYLMGVVVALAALLANDEIRRGMRDDTACAVLAALVASALWPVAIIRGCWR